MEIMEIYHKTQIYHKLRDFVGKMRMRFDFVFEEYH